VIGAVRASLLGVPSISRSGERRSFLRADSAIVVAARWSVRAMWVLIAKSRQGNASVDATSPACSQLTPDQASATIIDNSLLELFLLQAFE
jgi:hypothetical protein